MEKHLAVDTGDAACALFLELAAGDDADGLRHAPPGAADEVGLWYGRSKGSARMVLEHRTPLMVASTYGSLAVIRLLLSLRPVDVNRRCGPDAAIALHCAASGGSQSAVRLLLAAGADADAKDGAGCRPADVVAVPPNLPYAKVALKELLGSPKSEHSGMVDTVTGTGTLRVVTTAGDSGSPWVLLPTVEDVLSPCAAMTTTKFADLPRITTTPTEKKEYPVDPSLPDINNSTYAFDDFLMFVFKVRPCSQAYLHDWTE